MISTRKSIKENTYLKAQIATADNSLEELEMLVEKLGIDQFELDEIIGAVIAPMKTVVLEHQEQYQHKKSLISSFLSQKTEVDRQILGVNGEVEKGQRRCEEIDRLLGKLSLEAIAQLRNEKIQLQTEQIELEKGAFSVQIQNFWQSYGQKLNLEEKSDF